MKQKRHALSLSVAGNTKNILTLCLAFALAAVCQTVHATTSGIADLVGVDPSASLCTTNCPTDDNTKIFYLYNVGTKKFLNIGGARGAHADLSSTPYAIWLESYDDGYSLNTASTGSYVAVSDDDLWMNGSQSGTYFQFVQASGYDADTDKRYIVNVTSNSQTWRLTATPDNPLGRCRLADGYETTDDSYSNQVWKIISKSEYLSLLGVNSAEMKDIVAVPDLVKDPDFRWGDTSTPWSTSDTKNVYIGTKYSKCAFSDRTTASKWSWNETDGGSYDTYSPYTYCFVKLKDTNVPIYQTVKVNKPGLYIVRCNGFSTLNVGERQCAFLWAKANNVNYYKNLCPLDSITALALEEKDYGTGVGQAFYNGQYENQLSLYIETASEASPVTVMIGFYVRAKKDASEDYTLTCMDNFKISYAGLRSGTDLVLSEDLDNMKYISGTSDTYTNSTLHLQHTFNTRKWNSLVLPVSLTKGQVKRAFGDSVRVAKLATLTDRSIQFVTVEPADDDATIIEAFEPYIIYPQLNGVTTPAYTASITGYDGITAAANHYVIPWVTLDRTAFTNKVKTDSDSDSVPWQVNLFSGTSSTMSCVGTMAKTYDDNGIISKRDDLAGDYFFYKGQIIQVPSGKKYGMKAFRFWFDCTDATDKASVAVYIDGVFDSGETAIDDISGEGVFTSRRHGIDGVFDLYGSLVRRGTQTGGLPKGIYITGGRKVVVK